MRISDWSSDVCSSDLQRHRLVRALLRLVQPRLREDQRQLPARRARHPRPSVAVHGGVRGDGAGDGPAVRTPAQLDRKSVVKGKSVSVRVDLGGRRIIKKKKKHSKQGSKSRIEV